MSRSRGASSIRVKREIVEILKKFPDGLPSTKIMEKLKESKLVARPVLQVFSWVKYLEEHWVSAMWVIPMNLLVNQK